mmetsp:Transcript_19311/g.35029  ORF Transcript_19311/g.35029 Transcript_19311/m.35029 type:complete len:201 (+) Transcript_19311:305-907(+)
MKLRAVDRITKIIEYSIGNKSNEIIFLVFLAHQSNEILCNLDIWLLVLSSNVINVANLSLAQDAIEGIGDIRHKQKVTSVGSISVKSDNLIPKKLVRELGDELLGKLVGSVHVVTTSDNGRELERPVVRLDQKLSSSLGGSVGVGGLKNVLLGHGVRVEVLTLSVHLIGRDVNKATDARAHFGRFEQNVRSVNVGMSKCK